MLYKIRNGDQDLKVENLVSAGGGGRCWPDREAKPAAKYTFLFNQEHIQPPTLF